MNRDISYSRQHSTGFTWIEIVVVIAIVLALVVFVVFALLPGGHPRDLKQTSVTLKNLSLRIEEYASEHNGIYPVGEDGSSAVLYRALSGDESGRGEAPTGPVYWKELNDPKNVSLVGNLNGKKIIIDSFGYTFRYWSALDQNKKPVRGVNKGSDYDLWSTGPDGKPTDLSTRGTLMSEETKDDIWAFARPAQ